MDTITLHLLLADDDADDCFLFKEALNELSANVHLTIVNDGVQLMDHLTKPATRLPDGLFLDLNMPIKSGFECLTEIKQHQHLQQLPVILFSTSLDLNVVNFLREQGAHYYIRKPAEFSKLKKVVSLSLEFLSAKVKPTPENFIITT